MLKKEQLIKKSLLVGVGIAAYAQEKAEALVKELVKHGHINPNEGKKLVKTIYQEADTSRKRIIGVVEAELKRLFNIAETAKGKKKK